MTTPTSALGMSHIQTEFGGSNPIAISEYYGVNANVPGSGTIAMSKFLGISAATVSISANYIGDVNYSSGYVKAYSLYRANGQYSSIVDVNTVTGNSTWLVAGAAGDFQIRFTKYAGTNPTFVNSANNAWYAMSSDRGVYLESVSGNIYAVASIYVTVRRTSDSVIVANVIHTLVIESK